MTHLANSCLLLSNVYLIFIFYYFCLSYINIFSFWYYNYVISLFLPSNNVLPALSSSWYLFFINCCYIFETLSKFKLTVSVIFGWEVSSHSVLSLPPDPFSIFLFFFYFLLGNLLFILHVWKNIYFPLICFLDFHQLLFDNSATHILLL